MIKHKPDPAAVIRALRSAAPYIRLFKGKTFVVKAGGGVFGDAEATRGLIEQVAILQALGCRYAQGYYFSRPVAKDVLLETMNKREETNLFPVG